MKSIEKKVDMNDPAIEPSDDSLDYVMSKAMIGVADRARSADAMMLSLIRETIAKNKAKPCRAARF